jgi:hypothetical protein
MYEQLCKIKVPCNTSIYSGVFRVRVIYLKPFVYIQVFLLVNIKGQI